MKNVKQFLQNPHDVYRIEGFLAATKKDLALTQYQFSVGLVRTVRFADSPNNLITGFSELKIIRLRPIVSYQRAVWKSKMG